RVTQPLGVNFFGRREQIAPNLGCRGKSWQGAAESFDYQPAIIACAMERLERLEEINMPGSRSPAIVFTYMHVDDAILGSGDGLGDVLFLDIRVKRVPHHFAVIMIDALHEGMGISRRGEKVALEAIEELDHQLDVYFLGFLGSEANDFRAQALLVFGRRRAGEYAERRAERSRQEFAAQDGGILGGAANL